MKIVMMFLFAALVARADPLVEPKPDTPPAYFAKLAMVKMWPQPQEPLTADEVAGIQRGERIRAYTVAHYNPSGKLWTVEEIVAGKRKIKFAYGFDPKEQVTEIDMFLPDGRAKIYYTREVKVRPAAAAPVAGKPVNPPAAQVQDK